MKTKTKICLAIGLGAILFIVPILIFCWIKDNALCLAILLGAILLIAPISIHLFKNIKNTGCKKTFCLIKDNIKSILKDNTVLFSFIVLGTMMFIVLMSVIFPDFFAWAMKQLCGIENEKLAIILLMLEIVSCVLFVVVFTNAKKHFMKAILVLFIAFFVILFIVLVVAILSVIFSNMFSDGFAYEMGRLLGIINKEKIITMLAFGIGGCLTALGAMALIWRAKVADESNILERFNAATGHLASGRAGARTAAFYEFYHLSKNDQEMEKLVFNTLCAHIRQITTALDYRGTERPTEEIQTLLELLFTKKIGVKDSLKDVSENMPEDDDNDKDYKDYVFNTLWANLQRAKLKGANLYKARLVKARLQGTDLSNADLEKANLSGAKLQGADLSEVENIKDAILDKAIISKETIFPDDYKPITEKNDEDEMYIVRIEKIV